MQGQDNTFGAVRKNFELLTLCPIFMGHFRMDVWFFLDPLPLKWGRPFSTAPISHINPVLGTIIQLYLESQMNKFSDPCRRLT